MLDGDDDDHGAVGIHPPKHARDASCCRAMSFSFTTSSPWWSAMINSSDSLDLSVGVTFLDQQRHAASFPSAANLSLHVPCLPRSSSLLSDSQ